MGFRIVTNSSSQKSLRYMRNTRRLLDQSLERLSSGYRINKAGDDAAGLAISEKLRAKIRGLLQAQRNANDAISLVQTVEGALNEVHNILVRMRELGVQAASDTIGDNERKYLNNEYRSLKEEIERIANSTEFNGIHLLDGTGGILEFQINTGGENILGVDRIIFDSHRCDVNIDKLGIADLSIGTKKDAQECLARIDDSVDYISSIRGDLGALQNRLISTVNSIGISTENLSAANSRVKDLDVAEETAELTKNQILMQANLAVMQQANALPRMALQLLQN